MRTKGTFFEFQLWMVCLVVLHFSCTRDINSIPSQHIEKGLQTSEAPFSMGLDAASFHPNIVYGDSARNKYDFFKPNFAAPSSLLILIHGGGFVSGDKSTYYDSYRYRGLVNRMLDKNIAVATINYRFVDPFDKQGILNSLTDVKLALQHMRYFSDSLHFNSEKVMLQGSSAGGAAAMWIGFQDDMAIKHDKNPILSETTRVQGIVGVSTQANYDIANWHETVFSSFKKDGFTAASLEALIKEYRILLYYGVNNREDLSSEEMQNYLKMTNMLKMLSADDPPFYIMNTKFSGDIPTNMSEVFHHPLHVKTIQQQAEKVGAKGSYHCPQINLDTTKGETPEAFIVRIIGN
ncbi:hypothetical protein KORDIASMS9_03496 [Kordia sp. SMS9]|uniref:alpha/beta hydrolase n=1 Tax=Kordia sp. SMS9 TaxID=2282170 RepID=UPI000E0D22B3|nr:alpha/beta hydrolase [Kordia sp. SMS9]AXG71239.1 hypothetical protein KORDIASMS9_03496 [Kordia sp. SMS9]